MKKSTAIRLSSLYTLGILLISVPFVSAGPAKTPIKKAGKKPTVKNKATSPASSGAAPVNMGNGILILGEDSGAGVAQAALVRPTTTKQAIAATQSQLSAQLVRFCRSYLGRKLGNGQCSELAMLGLPAVGAQMDLNNQWGNLVCDFSATGGRQSLYLGAAGQNPKNPRQADIRPGDLIQYKDVKFEKWWDGGYSFKTYPHHTSVIEQVSRDGRTVKVLEQNINGTQYVLETELYLPELTEGTMRITRPIPR